AKSAVGALTIGADPASKYYERPAGHPHRHWQGPPGNGRAELRPCLQAAKIRPRAGGHPARNRSTSGTWCFATRRRDKRLMAAEKKPTASHGRTDVGDLSIEERYDEVRQLINIGKEKGYLLYDEVNEMLPSEITSSDELDDLFNTFGSAGIEVIDSDQKYLRDDVKPIDRTAEGAEELELDLTPGALDKTNDPVRMYL